jgi:flagellar biosynthesis component FlhA
LQVYLLGPKLKQLLMDKIAQSRVEKGAKRLEEAELNRILDVFRQMAAALPATAEWPAVLANDETRPFLSQLLAVEFPRLRVFAQADLSPHLNIAPTDRLELSE